jgi:hypothetical protein
MNHLDSDLTASIRPFVRGGTLTGPTVWMRIVGEVQLDSIRRLKKVQEKLETLKLASFKGENVCEFAQLFLDLCIELENAKRLPEDVLLTVVEALSKCTVKEFRIDFMSKRSAVKRFMRETTGKDSATIARMSDRLTYRDLLDEAKSKYTSLLDSGLWGPAGGSGDKSGAPAGFLTKAEVNVLIQKAVSGAKNGDKSSITCYKCKEVGHYSRDCKNKAVDGNGTNSKPKKSKASWRTVAPKSGESETKTENKLEWHWCANCKEWRVGHSTTTHDHNFKPKEAGNGKKGPKANLAATGELLGGGTLSMSTGAGLYEEW